VEDLNAGSQQHLIGSAVSFINDGLKIRMYNLTKLCLLDLEK